MTRLHRPLAFLTIALMLLAASACGGPSSSPSASEAASATARPSQSASAEASSSTAPVPTPGPTGPASVTGPATAIAGAPIEVSWNGPNENDDYVTIVAAGATKWTNESWFYTRSSSNGTGTLQTSVVDGDYELWYVQGDTDAVLSRTAIRLLPWAGTLDGPASVKVNTQFQVTWTGPDGQGDYVAILPSGATAYTNESYFYTHSTTNGVGSLLSPMAAGNYQLSYLAGTGEIMLSEPITVTP